jgi:hypothetical protein
MTIYPTKKEGLKALNENPLSCVHFKDKGKLFDAVYWNGKIKILPHNKKIYWGKL